ncbi:hypothetical protein NUW58_g4963 [Xylaria curta]|uniref:Uncharacterized protein n=1 Tax=Xylaria curta TaxID=42375 RepID=A0ACC1P403_9PEZI|nr:hypothetical protein NUW58_g4963 [Xylaria curta]
MSFRFISVLIVAAGMEGKASYPSLLVIEGAKSADPERSRLSHAKNEAAPPKKLALLIGSPVGQLRRTGNDVQRMSDLLSRHGFRITTCSGKLYGMRATRERIRKRWKELNSQCAPDDTVVIYYSGHGGLIQLTKEEMEKIDAERAQPWRYQFIVPIDYYSGSDFRGVLDVELTRWLRDTTRKTHNVTVIFDCCHSARMAKNGEDNGFQVKSISNASYQAASGLLNELRESGDPEDHIFIGGNPYAVRIAAAAADSFAWETDVKHRILDFRAKRNYGGLLTRNLVDVIEEAEESSKG